MRLATELQSRSLLPDELAGKVADEFTIKVVNALRRDDEAALRHRLEGF